MGHIAGKHQARAVASCKGTPQLRAYCKVCLTGSAGTDLGSCRVSFQLLASVYVWQAPQDRLPSKMHQQRFVMKSLPQSWLFLPRCVTTAEPCAAPGRGWTGALHLGSPSPGAVLKLVSPLGHKLVGQGRN